MAKRASPVPAVLRWPKRLTHLLYDMVLCAVVCVNLVAGDLSAVSRLLRLSVSGCVDRKVVLKCICYVLCGFVVRVRLCDSCCLRARVVCIVLGLSQVGTEF